MRTILPALCAIAAVAFGSATAAQTSRVNLDIKPQPMRAALKAFGDQTGMQVLYRVGDVAKEGITSPPLNGEFSAREALERLLANSGLRYEFINDRTVRIAPVRGGVQTTSYAPRAEDPAAMTLASSAEPADGQDRATPADDGKNTGVHAGAATQPSDRTQEIVVTGTHLRGIAPESSPVLVFTRDDLQTSGHTTVEQFLRSVPQNFSGGPNQENFNVTFSGADVTEQGASVNLRGLGARATLVLVNGRRLAPSSFAGSYVDVSLIPISAVERIEVLTNGASAIYGSDAVGGVVNFILREDFSGLETSLHVGTATEGDGDQLMVAQTAGGSWGSGHALVAYEYRAEDAVLARDRNFTRGIPPRTFFLPQERRHSVFAALGQDLTDRLTLDMSGSFSTRDTVRDFIPSTSPLLVAADADSSVYSLGADLTYQLANQWRLQGSAAFSRNDSASSQFQSGGTGIINDGDFTNELGEAGVKVDGDLFRLPAGAAKIAVGLQYRREDHEGGFITASQISAGVPRTMRSASRNSRAAFTELLIPLVSGTNRFAGMERLELNVAARHERYSDFGDATDPKLGLLWSPLQGLAVRGTWGTSFRAPLLTETLGQYNVYYWPNTASLYAAPGDPQQGVGVILRVLGQNPDLQPESSDTWTAGVLWQPGDLRGFSLSADYFSTQFSDRIAAPTPTISRIIGNPAFDPIVLRNPTVQLINAYLAGAADVQDVSGPGFTSGGATPADVSILLDTRISNSAITSTSGVDVAMNYGLSFGAHELGLRASMTYLFDFAERLTSASPVSDVLDRPYRPLSMRANAGLSWSHGQWSSSAVFNHVGSYTDARFNPVRPVGSFDYVDLNIAYRMGPSAAWLSGARLALSVMNAFDTLPPALSPDPGQVRGVGYDPVNASGRGRFVALQLQKTWGAAH